MNAYQLKTPSFLETGWQILLFLLFQKEIAQKYHTQMVLLRGCSQKFLFLYVKKFSLSNGALILLFQKADKAFLQHFLSHYYWDFPQDCEQILLDRFGHEFLIDNANWTLSTQAELTLLQQGNVELIKKYIAKYVFTPEAEVEFFKLPFLTLQEAYTEKNNLSQITEKFLLETKKFNLLSIHFSQFGLSDKLVETFYQNAPNDLISRYLSHSAGYPSDKEFKILLSKSVADFIKQLVLSFNELHLLHLKMLLKSKNVVLVRAYLEQKAEQASSLPDTVWRGLFDTSDLKKLLHFALEHFDLPEEFEICLFKSQFLDLLESYTHNHAFQNWGFPMLLALGKRDLLLNYLSFHKLSWSDECLLIEQKDEELIAWYLKKHSLSSYALGYRIKSANFFKALEIVQSLDKFDDFVLDALFYHNEEELWCVYLSFCKYRLKPDILLKFAEKAGVNIILDYLSHYLIDGELDLKLDDSKFEDILYLTFYKRQQEELTSFLMKHTPLTDIRDYWFISYSSYDFIKQLLEKLFNENIWLSAEAEKELIFRKYEDLLRLYFSHHSLYQENLFLMAQLLSPELMRDYLLSHREDNNFIQQLLS